MTTDPSRPRYVVDTSVVLKWFVQSDESDGSQARELRAAYVQKRCTLSCPEFLVLELANALRTGRRFTAAEIKVIAESFRTLDLVLEALRWSTLAKAVELAASLNAAVYDSYFLASAIESSSILVTADDLFVRKVGRHPNLSALRQLRLTG
ncbi:MAG: type II toxin-antitoxin system VapC family toxin [Terriglobia bacterium]